VSNYFENKLGRVYIDPSIIKQVILPEVIASKTFRPLGASSDLVDANPPVPRSLEKTVKIDDKAGRVNATVSVGVLYGTAIWDEATKVQKKIREAVESSTGLKVENITLNVEQVYLPGNKKK